MLHQTQISTSKELTKIRIKRRRINYVINVIKVSLEVEEADSKVLANFMFREIIEDVHAKYKIPGSEIKKM